MARPARLAGIPPTRPAATATVTVPPAPHEAPVAGPNGKVFGDGGHARRILFIFDSTSSMMQEALPAMEELMQTVYGLGPEQAFNVVLLCDGPEVRALDSEHLLPATPDNKRNAALFLDTLHLTGTADPAPVLRLAFRQKPDLIYILCDGRTVVDDWASHGAVDEINCLEAAAGHAVAINTILWNNDLEGSADLLAQIARDNRGHFRFVREVDVVGR